MARLRARRTVFVAVSSVTLVLFLYGIHHLYPSYRPAYSLFFQDPVTDNAYFNIDHDIHGHVPGRIAYLSIYNQIPDPLKLFGLVGLLAWLLILFGCGSIVAGDYFCHNLSTIASGLGLSESVAGVTFLGFGNGSPDVFSTFTAMRAGTGSLALGELLGASLFIVTIVAGSLPFIRPFQVPARSFLRDVSFLGIAVGYSLFIMMDGIIHLWEASGLILLYLIYVVVVVIESWQTGQEIHSSDGFVFSIDPDDAVTSQKVGKDHVLSGQLPASQDIHRTSSSQTSSEEANGELRDPAAPQDLVGAVAHLHLSLKSTSDGSKAIQCSSSRSLNCAPHQDLEVEAVPCQVGTRLSQQFAIHPPVLRPSFLSAIEYHEMLSALRKLPSQPDPVSYPRRRCSRSLGQLDFDRVAISRSVHSSPSSPTEYPSHSTPNIFFNNGLTRSCPSNSPSLQNTRQDIVNAEPSSAHSDPSCNAVLDYLTSPPKDQITNETPTTLSAPIVKQDIMRSNSFDSRIPDSSPSEIRMKRITHIIFKIMFPMMEHFWDKSLLAKIVGVSSLPAVILFNLTLPVVRTDENKSNDDNESSVIGEAVVGELDDEENRVGQVPRIQVTSADSINSSRSPEELVEDVNLLEEQVMKFLRVIQVIIAPAFCVMVFWPENQMERDYQIYMGCAGIIGLVSGTLFGLIGDRWRGMYMGLAMVGFAVSIAWISTIINEVVGVLECIGKILGLSNAIVGLTIFAVGNSLTDLISNLTMGRMGFQVMAISACYGSPLLNLLLGVGLSSTYLIGISKSQGPYRIDFPLTLIVSAIGLLFILLGTLIFVPLNGFRIDRRWGFTLILSYLVIFSINILVELRTSTD